MKYMILVLLALSSITAQAKDLTFEEGVQIKEAWLLSLEQKFEKHYPRANILLVYCRANMALKDHKKVTEESLEGWYRNSDTENEKSMTTSETKSVIKDLNCG